ncbi:MAG: hypothetical protein AAGA34_01595 [Pseudomonadota bacterium]
MLDNLAIDPTERTDLADGEPEKRAELLALLDAHQADRKPALYPSMVGGVTKIDTSLAGPYEPGDECVIWSNSGWGFSAIADLGDN